jgi:hypothetical protein
VGRDEPHSPGSRPAPGADGKLGSGSASTQAEAGWLLWDWVAKATQGRGETPPGFPIVTSAGHLGAPWKKTAGVPRLEEKPAGLLAAVSAGERTRRLHTIDRQLRLFPSACQALSIAICELFGRCLRPFWRVRMQSMKQSWVLRPPGRRTYGCKSERTPRPPSSRKKPRPTVARGTGRYTDLAFPTPAKERRKRGGGV